jgi:hypothetical protein
MYYMAWVAGRHKADHQAAEICVRDHHKTDRPKTNLTKKVCDIREGRLTGKGWADTLLDHHKVGRLH